MVINILNSLYKLNLLNKKHKNAGFTDLLIRFLTSLIDDKLLVLWVFFTNKKPFIAFLSTFDIHEFLIKLYFRGFCVISILIKIFAKQTFF